MTKHTKNRQIKDTRIGQCSHIGLVRKYNKDAYGCFNTAKGELFLVADGMGVKNDGIKAAELAISEIHKYIDWYEAPMEELLVNAILAADKAIIKASKGLFVHKGFTMGSTVVLLLFQKNTVYYVHLGDSRLYLLREGKLQQLTEDHSQVQDLIDKGEVSKGEATVHSLRNKLTQYLGCGLDIIAFTVKKLEYKNNDTFLLCTDGLWDMVSEAEIKSTLEMPTPLQEQVDSLIESALKAGGDDNITMQIVQRHFVERSLSFDISTLSLEHEEKELEVNRDLVEREPNDTQAQKNVLVSLYKIGYIYFKCYNFLRALKAYKEALEISRKLVQNEPNNKYWQSEVAMSLNGVAKIYKEYDGYEDPFPLYQESLEISHQLVQHNPKNIQWQSNAMISQYNIGGIHASRWEYKKSLSAYQEALKISRKLMQLDPNNLQWQKSTIRSLYWIGVLLLHNNKSNKAFPILQESLEMSRTLVIRNPSNMLKYRDVAAALHKIGDTRKKQGKRGEALTIYKEAFEINRKLVTYDKKYSQQRGEDAWININRYQRANYAAEFRTQNILKPYEEALEINRKLVRYAFDNIKWQTELTSSLCDISKVLWMLKMQLSSDEAYEEALEISRKLLRHDPNNKAKSSLALAFYNSGVEFDHEYNQKKALRVYQESLKIQRKLVQCDPSNIQWSSQLVYFLDSITYKVYHYDKIHGRRKALALIQESIVIIRKLAQYEPEYLKWQIDLAESLRMAGHILIELCKQNEALPLYQESLEISLNLEQDEPENLRYRSYTARALGNIGYILLTQYKFNEAFAAFRKCVEINHNGLFDDSSQDQKKVTNLLRYKSMKLSNQGKHDEAFVAILVCLQITRRIMVYAPNQNWKRYIVVHMDYIDSILKKEEIKKRFKLYSEGTEFAQIVNRRILKKLSNHSIRYIPDWCSRIFRYFHMLYPYECFHNDY